MPRDPLFVVAVLALNIAICEWLVRHTRLRAFGSALLVIVVTAVTANLGIVPVYSEGAPIYDAIFRYVAPIGIFWLLLQVNLRSVLQVGAPLLGLFLVGALGTSLGVYVGMLAVDGASRIGEGYDGVAGMFVGTYTGGSVNFNALALATRIHEKGTLYVGATAVDSFMTTIWMIVTLLLPRWLGAKPPSPEAVDGETPPPGEEDTERMNPFGLGLLLALGAASLFAAEGSAPWLSARLTALVGGEWSVPPILVITGIALVLAQHRAVNHIAGTRALGMFAIYLFLAVIGALCEVAAFRELGGLGVTLLVFVTVALAVHGVVTFGVGRLFGIDPALAAVASQANVGGSTSALALARSLGRPDLVLPAILVGSLGTAIGTPLGLVMVGLL